MLSVEDILQVQITVVIRLRGIFVVLACHILGPSEAQFPPIFSSSIGKTRPRGVSFAVPFSGDIAWRPRNPFSLPFERLPRRLLAISSTIDFIFCIKNEPGI